MTSKDLVKKLQILKEIKPRKDWVISTKNQILGDYQTRPAGILDIFPRLISQPKLAYRPVFATLFTLTILLGTLGFAQYSLPGDILYPIKRVTEKSQALFVSEKELPCYNLEIANKRLEELSKIAETNQAKKLAPAIKEAQTSVSQVTKNLVKSETIDKETVDEIMNLKKNLEMVETTLGTKIGSEEDEQTIENWTKKQTNMLIEDLEGRILTGEQEEVLAQMKELVEEGKYSEALELYLINQ
jgi:hypothetical protein